MINNQNTDEELISAALSVKTGTQVVGEKEIINEGINDHEELHKKVLKDMHKHYPEMNVKNSKHIEKRTGVGGNEYHKYSADIPIHDSVKHLFKILRAETTIHHTKNDGHTAHLEYRYEHHDYGGNGKSVASHFHDKSTGKHHIRHEKNGIISEA